MGKCVKCGNETKNAYKYYSSDCRKCSKIVDVVTDIKLEYFDFYNVTEQKEYYCTKCDLKSTRLGWLITTIIVLIFSLSVTLFRGMGIDDLLKGGFILYIFTAIPLIIFLAVHWNIKKDKYIGENGERAVFNLICKKLNKDGLQGEVLYSEGEQVKAFHTPERYLKIKEELDIIKKNDNEKDIAGLSKGE